MNIVEYLNRINTESQQIFNESILEVGSFGKAQHLTACIFEFSELLADTHEKKMLTTVSAQLESASINIAMGLYRQAFSSLRLAFEMGLGAVNFSIHKLDHYEWLIGKSDIKWAVLVDTDNGILSKRFANAFFPEAIDIVDDYNNRARKIYRNLSEFVHGNNETWTQSGIELKYNKPLLERYFKSFYEVSEIILFALCCRYLKSFNEEQLDMIGVVADELNHISCVRERFGGPKA